MARREQTLVAHCTALLCRHLPEVLDQCGDQLATFPRSTKAALLASLRRRFAGVDAAESEVDRCVLSLTDESQTTIDLSGLPVSDAAAVALAPRLARLRALDVRCCSLLTAQGLRELLAHTTELRVLRWGGCAASDRAARGALASLLPQLRQTCAPESSWESPGAAGLSHQAGFPSCCSPLLQFLAWPEADARSAARLARCCPRIKLLQAPQPGPVPLEADVAVALDAHALEALSPLVDAVSSMSAPAEASFVAECERTPARPHIAELFRLAYEARDLRLAPKRAKNARQRERREQRTTANSAAGALAALYRADLLPADTMAGLCICDI